MTYTDFGVQKLNSVLTIFSSRPSKGVRPTRRSEENLPPSKPAAPRPLGGVPKKLSAPPSRGGKVIDSRNRGGGAAPGARKGVPGRKPVGGKEKVCVLCEWLMRCSDGMSSCSMEGVGLRGRSLSAMTTSQSNPGLTQQAMTRTWWSLWREIFYRPTLMSTGNVWVVGDAVEPPIKDTLK